MAGLETLPKLEPLVGGTMGAPWVTFVPGIGNDAGFWRRQADELIAYRTLRFEPWGVGGSEPPPDKCTIDTVAGGIVALWDELGIERSHVVGLGFGGSAALYLGLAHPERVEKVVACCCRPRQPDGRRQFWRERQEFARAHGLAELADITVDRWLSADFRAAHPEITEELVKGFRRSSVEGYCAYVDAFIEMDFSDRLGELGRPTLLVAAEHDHGGGPVDAMRAMAAELPHADLAIVTGSGHICTAEQPEQVTTLLRDFLG